MKNDDRETRYDKDREQTDYQDYDAHYRRDNDVRPRFDEETGEPLEAEDYYAANDDSDGQDAPEAPARGSEARDGARKDAAKDADAESKHHGGSFQDKKTPVKVLGMIGAAIVLVLVIIGIVAIVTFFKNRANDQLTPRRTAQAMIEAVSHDDFERFQSLYPGKEALGPEASRQVYQQIRDSLHHNAVTSDYVLIRQQNGRDILIAMEYNEHTKQYEIYDVRIVPADDKDIFIY